MEILYTLFLAISSGILLPLIVFLTGLVGGRTIAWVLQKGDPRLQDQDIRAIRRAWLASFGLGGVLAAFFLGAAMAATSNWKYWVTGFSSAIGFLVIGLCAGLIGVRKTIKVLDSLRWREQTLMEGQEVGSSSTTARDDPVKR